MPSFAGPPFLIPSGAGFASVLPPAFDKPRQRARQREARNGRADAQREHGQRRFRERGSGGCAARRRPTVPPSPRKNSAREIALPTSRGSTAVWAAMLVMGMFAPMPNPSTADEHASCTMPVAGPTRHSSIAPAPSTRNPTRLMVRIRPFAPNTRPASVLPTTSASVIGIVASAEAVDVSPSPSCTNRGTNITPTSRANCEQNPIATAPFTCAQRKNRTGTMAWSRRRSTSTSSAIMAAASASSPKNGAENQARALPVRLNASVSGTMAAAAHRAPGKSNDRSA